MWHTWRSDKLAEYPRRLACTEILLDGIEQTAAFWHRAHTHFTSLGISTEHTSHSAAPHPPAAYPASWDRTG
ncbi:hypothetical protein SAMN05216275_13358 [Streptosporangium canum]|uniref:Uncharacterized protein n=1 Tax=Streptosporangium canum TaxID=324952 RepID=A0A1I4BVE6_9ACTN|nr:hypothetical protein SAMN05216275_13358 [Streptosporangium canum]